MKSSFISSLRIFIRFLSCAALAAGALAAQDHRATTWNAGWHDGRDMEGWSEGPTGWDEDDLAGDNWTGRYDWVGSSRGGYDDRPYREYRRDARGWNRHDGWHDRHDGWHDRRSAWYDRRGGWHDSRDAREEHRGWRVDQDDVWHDGNGWQGAWHERWDQGNEPGWRDWNDGNRWSGNDDWRDDRAHADFGIRNWSDIEESQWISGDAGRFDWSNGWQDDF